MNRLRRLGLETMFVVLTAIVVSSAVPSHANDATKAAVIGDVEDVAKSVPASARLQVAKVPSPTNGLQLKSLEIVGRYGKRRWAHPSDEFRAKSVEVRAEFVWGQHAIAQRDWESPIEIFQITFSEKTKDQKVQLSKPVLRATTGNPIQFDILNSTELRVKGDGCWATVIIFGRDSPTEPARLLANQTKYVTFVPEPDVGQETDNQDGSIQDPESEP